MINQLYIWAARVNLYIFYFFDSPLSEARRLGILKAYSAACTLTAKISAGDTLFDMLETAPSFLFRMLFTASSILLKVLNSSYVRYVDFDAGKTDLQYGHQRTPTMVHPRQRQRLQSSRDANPDVVNVQRDEQPQTRRAHLAIQMPARHQPDV